MAGVKKHVAFATGSRADYGIVRRWLRLLEHDEGIDLTILVTGALLDERYGCQVSLIEEDGFQIGLRAPLPLDPSSELGAPHAMAVALDRFSEHFSRCKYDLLIILGDRYEMLPVAMAAAMLRIPILHVHGGEATFGNYDEFIRHAITKMSLYHFTATENYRRRVIQLGENPSRVWCLGALGAENCLSIDTDEVPSWVSSLEEKSYYVILFHPETLTSTPVSRQMDELLAALDQFQGYRFVLIGSNADTRADFVRDRARSYASIREGCRYVENLKTGGYHYLLKHSIALVGNSSSGLIEAPSLGVPTVNIGERQAGRDRGASVIDVPCSRRSITAAMRRVREMSRVPFSKNPYYRPKCAESYYATTLEILDRVGEESSAPKVFFDIA